MKSDQVAAGKAATRSWIPGDLERPAELQS